MTIKELAERLAAKMASDYNNKYKELHLTVTDYEMFDRIFDNIQYNEAHPHVTYQEHFSLLPGWKPNSKVLSSQSSEQRRGKRVLPSLVRPSRL